MIQLLFSRKFKNKYVFCSFKTIKDSKNFRASDVIQAFELTTGAAAIAHWVPESILKLPCGSRKHPEVPGKWNGKILLRKHARLLMKFYATIFGLLFCLFSGKLVIIFYKYNFKAMHVANEQTLLSIKWTEMFFIQNYFNESNPFRNKCLFQTIPILIKLKNELP